MRPANISEYQHHKNRIKAEKMTLKDEIAQHKNMIRLYKEEIVALKYHLRHEESRQRKNQFRFRLGNVRKEIRERTAKIKSDRAEIKKLK